MKTCIFLIGIVFIGFGQIKRLSSAQLDSIITNHAADYDFILLDVRESYEVEDGVIGSECCKPYQMAWNSNVLQEKYTLLPDGVPIMVYCRSGNRSMSAAHFLAEKGFEDVSSLDGGFSSYDGGTLEVGELKKINNLPEPSYFGKGCEQVPVNHVKPELVRGSGTVNLKKVMLVNGQIISKDKIRKTAALIKIERIGDNVSVNVAGNGILRKRERQ